MKKSKKIKVYNPDGSTNLKHCVNKSGVYIVYSGQKVEYVGYSASNLYKTILRHFQQWNDRTQYRAKFNNSEHTVRIVLTSPTQAMVLENALINKHTPNFNKQITLLYPKNRIKKVLDEYNGLEDIPF